MSLSIRSLALALCMMLPAVPAAAQDNEVDDSLVSSTAPAVRQDNVSGRVANSAVGEAGQRQTRGQEVGGIKPMARINTRIANRVQSRLRTRIDRYSEPDSRALSPFVVAEEEARTASRRLRRR